MAQSSGRMPPRVILSSAQQRVSRSSLKSASKFFRREILVGLDIGTTKICTIVGELKQPENDGDEVRLDIIGLGTAPSTGLRKGVVINIEETVESIRKSIIEAEASAGISIHHVDVGIAGSHIKSFNSHGVVAIKDKEIRPQDIHRVLDAARAAAIPQDREIIHVVPQEFMIDDQDGIRDPVGMSGVRLEAKVHIVTGAVTAVQNLIKCCRKADLGVNQVVLEPMASAQAVLTEDEKELGIILVDIGGGTTDVAVYSHGSLVHTQVIPIGGHHMTRDLAVGLRTPQSEAERMKIQHGCALKSLVRDEELIEVPGVGGRKSRSVPRKVLAEILEPRLEEIFQVVKTELTKNNVWDLAAAGVVITGGVSLLEGVCELGEMIFESPVKRGVPSGVGGLFERIQDPRYSTAVGLLQLAHINGSIHHQTKSQSPWTYEQLRSSMRGWLQDLF